MGQTIPGSNNELTGSITSSGTTPNTGGLYSKDNGKFGLSPLPKNWNSENYLNLHKEYMSEILGKISIQYNVNAEVASSLAKEFGRDFITSSDSDKKDSFDIVKFDSYLQNGITKYYENLGVIDSGMQVNLNPTTNKVTDNSNNKVTNNSNNKVTDNPNNKVTDNSNNKVSTNPNNKVTTGRIDITWGNTPSGSPATTFSTSYSEMYAIANASISVKNFYTYKKNNLADMTFEDQLKVGKKYGLSDQHLFKINLLEYKNTLSSSLTEQAKLDAMTKYADSLKVEMNKGKYTLSDVKNAWDMVQGVGNLYASYRTLEETKNNRNLEKEKVEMAKASLNKSLRNQYNNRMSGLRSMQSGSF